MRIKARAFRFGRGVEPESLKSRFSASSPGALVQTVHEGVTKNAFFLEMIAAQTLMAESSGSLLARKPGIDFVLRLAGDDQISRAIEAVGTEAGRPFLLVVASRRRIVVPRGHGGKELSRHGLSEADLARIEAAALLSARRG